MNSVLAQCASMYIIKEYSMLFKSRDNYRSRMTGLEWQHSFCQALYLGLGFLIFKMGQVTLCSHSAVKSNEPIYINELRDMYIPMWMASWTEAGSLGQGHVMSLKFCALENLPMVESQLFLRLFWWPWISSFPSLEFNPLIYKIKMWCYF